MVPSASPMRGTSSILVVSGSSCRMPSMLAPTSSLHNNLKTSCDRVNTVFLTALLELYLPTAPSQYLPTSAQRFFLGKFLVCTAINNRIRALQFLSLTIAVFHRYSHTSAYDEHTGNPKGKTYFLRDVTSVLACICVWRQS